MRVLTVRNVHQALPVGITLLRTEGIRRSSRAGTVWEHPEPVATVYEHPEERVLFWAQRDANPLFHLFEALWMLAGRRDVAWLGKFTSRMAQYSDDGETFHGAYGYRWRLAFGVDQIAEVETLLRRDPATRRAVVQMWHAPLDLGTESKDIPCNDLITFKIGIDHALRMTVFCRSNDLVYGACGTNAVHFSLLHSYLAERLGVAVGPYTQVSDSFHAYKGVWERCHALPVGDPCPYEQGEVAPLRLGTDDPAWDEDLHHLFTEPSKGFTTPWFRTVVRPLYWAAEARRGGRWGEALEWAAECRATDWARATDEWLRRRMQAHAHA